MYKNKSTIIKNKIELSNYIEEFDVYNSTLLEKLNDPSIQKVDYELTSFEFRPDLIAEDFYGSSDYLGIVILTAARGLETYTKGSIIKLIPISTLNEIINNI